GAYTAVRHLLSLGHRRIAHIQGPLEYLVSHDRYEGYCRALLEEGITPDPALVLVGDFLPPSGRACASKFFELPVEQRPTAIFAASDQMAYGVLAAAEEYDMVIPRDIALVGFDDDAPSVHTHPALTTVRQPYFEMGQRGIDLLLSLVDTPRVPSWRKGISSPTQNPAQRGSEYTSSTPTQPMRISLQTNLIVRASCGADYHHSILPSSGKVVL
ncbi:MAG: substrate-binding domain-containing protein, partial [Ktedonobacteraceae bacterium]